MLKKYQIVSRKVLKEFDTEEEAIKGLRAIEIYNTEKIKSSDFLKKKEIILKDETIVRVIQIKET